MLLDPVIGHVVILSFSLLFFTAGASKLRYQAEFAESLAGYRLMPPDLIRWVSPVIPVLEVALGLTLPFLSISILAAITLLLGYSLAIAINLRRGNLSLDCGCHYGLSRQSISWGLVIRNLVLVGFLFLALIERADRPIVLFDFLWGIFGVLVAYLLYQTANKLIANSSNYRELF